MNRSRFSKHTESKHDLPNDGAMDKLNYVQMRPTLNPAGAVTGIGSLPLKSEREAIQAIVESSPEVPFWPQLPQLSEREIVIKQALGLIRSLIEPRSRGYGFQVKEGAIDSVIEILHNSDGALTEESAAGFFAFEDAIMSGLFGYPLAIKGHIEGPITLSAYLFYKERPFLSDPQLFSSVAFHVSQLVCWQVERLRSAGVPVMLFVDEPALCLEVPSSAAVSEAQRLSALAAIFDDARKRRAYAGLHCCAARPFERMFRTRPDILSFDAHEGLEAFLSHPESVDFVYREGIVAYGLIPNKQDLDAMDSAHIFIRWLEAVARRGDPQRFAQRAMITATCGLGLLDRASMYRSFAVARGVSRLVRSLAGVSEEILEEA